jgi:hypothetical protein
MKRSSRLRGAANLSESVHQQLNMYALAAGVGVLALVQPSEAKIVYTSAIVKIGPNQHYNLDLNHDGLTDFTIEVTRDFRAWRLHASAAASNGVAGRDKFASALYRGAQIGSGQPFTAPDALMLRCSFGSHSRCSGLWLTATNRYLGLKFMIKGKTHCGCPLASIPTHTAFPGREIRATWVRKLLIPNAASENQEVQSLRGFHGSNSGQVF